VVVLEGRSQRRLFTGLRAGRIQFDPHRPYQILADSTVPTRLDSLIGPHLGPILRPSCAKIFFLVGLGVGSMIGILCAPKSGEETREYLAHKARQVSKYAQGKARSVKESAENLVELCKKSITHEKERIATVIAQVLVSRLTRMWPVSLPLEVCVRQAHRAWPSFVRANLLAVPGLGIRRKLSPRTRIHPPVIGIAEFPP
jgi:YtxH-like protein